MIAAVSLLLSGCATVPADPLVAGQAHSNVMKEVMARNNTLVLLSSPEFCRDKPVLLLLHGATDDPTEMMTIARAWMATHNVLLYSYNFHQSIEKVGLGLVKGMQARKTMMDSSNLTVITYSYSAIVFRKTILLPGAGELFAGASLIQLVPTAGGSFLARGLRYPVAVSLVSLASKFSIAENPYGAMAEELWDGEGNRRFCEIILPERMHTLRLEQDMHSLAGVPNEEVQKRYKNGLGPNVVTIPKSLGVTHDNFPNHPVVLEHLRRIMEATARERSGNPSLGDGTVSTHTVAGP